MKKLFILCTATVLFAACKEAETSPEQIDADYLIANVSAIDVADGTTLSNAYVAISGDSISHISKKEVTLADTTKVIDGTSKFLIPGLWDMHTHVSINNRYQQPLNVANGVVGVREMWATMDTIKRIREDIKAEHIIGPEIYASGAIIDADPPYWPGSDMVANAEDAKTILQKQKDEGVDFFKIYSLLERDAYFAIAEESKELGIAFGGHVPESVSLFEAIDAGQRTAEHLMKFIPACSTIEDKLIKTPGLSSFVKNKIDATLETFSEEKYDSLVKKLANGNTWLVPTMVTKRGIAFANDTLTFSTKASANPLIKYMPPHTAAQWASIPDFIEIKFGEGFFEANLKRYQKEMSLLADMQEKGVKFLAGTDYANPYCYPGFSLHQELKILVESGFSTLNALQTATYNPALFFEKEDKMGNVKKNMVADLLLLNANPLENIDNTKEIDAVFLKGAYLPRTKLNELLSEGKTLAKKEVNEMALPGFPLHIHE